MVNRFNTSEFIDNTRLDKKTATVTKETELKAEEDKIINLHSFNSNYF